MKAPTKGYDGRMRVRNLRTTCARVILGALLLLGGSALTGCTTGQPQSTSAWQSSSDRVLGTAISGLGTARIVVKQEQADRTPHSYAVVAATDAIETTGKEISSYQVAQPPDGLHSANATVGDALDEASSLLVDVRVAVASPGLTTETADRLVKRIDALRDKLDELDKAVEKSPESVGSR
jgi:hypothetical protein